MGRLALEGISKEAIMHMDENNLKGLYTKNLRLLSKKLHPVIKSEVLEQQDLIRDMLLSKTRNKDQTSQFLSEQLTIGECAAPGPEIYEKKVVQWLKGMYVPAVKEMNYCKRKSQDKTLYIDQLPSAVSSLSDLIRVSGGEENLSQSEKMLIRIEDRCDRYFARYLELKLEVDEMDKKIESALTLEQQKVINIKYIEQFRHGKRELSDEETIDKLPYEKTYYYQHKIKAAALANLANALGYL